MTIEILDQRKYAMRYIISAVTNKGIIRNDNQDNLFLNGTYRVDLSETRWCSNLTAQDPERGLFAVFDGVGGMQTGDEAALIACMILHHEGWIKRKPLDDVIQTANDKVFESSSISGRQMGTTCVILEEKEGSFRSWNIGDSRAYYYHDDQLIQLSRDHTEAENVRNLSLKIGEDIRITKAMEHTLTQYLGTDSDEQMIEPYISDWKKAVPGDIFMLCSDGLSDMAGDKKIAEILSKRGSAEAKCSALEEEALANGGHDNITIVLISAES